MKEHFDAVVIGSGFGGSVMTYRLAEAGLRVCLLERGRPYPPGSFPRTPSEVKRAFWDPSEGLYGLFDVWGFGGIDALVSSGLGGGSLIYANVLLRKDEAWFVDEEPNGTGQRSWPVTRKDLEPHYDRVEAMIGAEPYPAEYEPYRSTPKMQAFKAAAQAVGMEAFHPPLAITFRRRGEDPGLAQPLADGVSNLHGVFRSTCRLCGECDLGCNFGSKNTLDLTYLSRAKEHGAEVRGLTEVRSIAPHGRGYEVRYVSHDLAREGQKAKTRDLPVQTMTADRVVLAAGALGSTYLLLKSRKWLSGLSPALGTRFCGNGDLLGFAMNARRQGPGGQRVPFVLEPNRGPVITTSVRGGDFLDGLGEAGRGFYLQDAGYPIFLSWVVECLDVQGAGRRLKRAGRAFLRALLRQDTNFGAEVHEALGDEVSMSSLPLLGMGRDQPSGILRLNGRFLQSNWRVHESDAYFRRLKGTMEAITRALGGEFRVNPTWWAKRVVTVHPLGGSPMATNRDLGVVDPFGEVYGHPGLFVADGSILPGPVGPNPALTIAAMSDRIAERVLGR